jgi:hypothetical protein
MEKGGMKLGKLALLALLVTQLASLRSFAQSYTGDARRIGMGGTADNENLGSRMIADEQQYRSIVVPLGLIQVIRDRRYFHPDDDAFNPILLLEDMANPLHLSIRRGSATGSFVTDLVNARFSRDLNRYRGFVIAKEIKAQGLASPNYGHVFRFRTDTDGNFDGVYVGAGPYISAKTVFNVDDQLRQLLASSQDVVLRNATLGLFDQSSGEAAAAITFGYRRRMPFPGQFSSSGRQGLYLAGDYHYLRGFRYDSADLRVRFDTNSAGLLTLTPNTIPVSAAHAYSNKGNGFALDLGVGAVIDRWQFGFGANGIANRINWDNPRFEQITLSSLFTGGDFVRQPQPSSLTTIRVELPVETNGNVGYNGDSWAALVQVGHGFQGNTFHTGVEKRVLFLAFRGGTRHSRERWHPAAGLGFNLTRGFGVDVAAFDTTANIQQERRVSYAVSLRFSKEPRDN